MTAASRHAQEFRCPFHGWTWNIRGSLKHLVSEWDFPSMRGKVAQLPSAKVVATWGGFVLINPDPHAGSFENYAGRQMLAHYKKTKLQNRYKQADVTKVIRAIWKAVLEAFLEGWHSMATHPQLPLSGGDGGDVRFDLFGNRARKGHAGARGSSPHQGNIPSPEATLESYRQSADFMRKHLRGLIGEAAYSDMELVDQTFSNLFPDFSPWGGWAQIGLSPLGRSGQAVGLDAEPHRTGITEARNSNAFLEDGRSALGRHEPVRTGRIL